MSKYITVNQTHLYTKEKNLMYQGVARLEEHGSKITMSYTELDGHTKVKVIASELSLLIERISDTTTTKLELLLKTHSTGCVMTEFGMIDINLFTHKYIRKDNAIAVEYDIITGIEVSDGFRIMWTIKEESL